MYLFKIIQILNLYKIKIFDGIYKNNSTKYTKIKIILT